jgi:7,8-dihydropterin-6-yl-methyl-4-(beta-D-ribofuranosyl)aminobenzene 5'-phosphate synthase
MNRRWAQLAVLMLIGLSCAHPGVVNVVREAKKLRGGDVHLVLGGFHLCWLNVLQIKGIVDGIKKEGVEKKNNQGERMDILGIVDGIKKEGVEKVAPCHCSGDLARSTFEKVYGENFILVGVGRRLEIKGE